MKNKHQEKLFHHFQMLNDFMKYFPSHEWLWDQDNDMQSNVKVKCTFIIRSTNKKGILILFLVYYTSFHAEYKKLLALFLQIFQSMRLCREKILFFFRVLLTQDSCDDEKFQTLSCRGLIVSNQEFEKNARCMQNINLI